MALEPKHLKGIQAILHSKSFRGAAKKLKISPHTLHSWNRMPEFKEALQKKSQEMLDVGMCIGRGMAIRWSAVLRKHLDSDNANDSLKACGMLTQFLCKHITQKIEAEAGGVFDVEKVRKMAKEIEDK